MTSHHDVAVKQQKSFAEFARLTFKIEGLRHFLAILGDIYPYDGDVQIDFSEIHSTLRGGTAEFPGSWMTKVPGNERFTNSRYYFCPNFLSNFIGASRTSELKFIRFLEIREKF